MADVYKSAEHPDKAQEVTDSVDKLSKSVDGLQGKITSTQQDLNDKFVKSQVRRAGILDLVTQTGTYQSRKQLWLKETLNSCYSRQIGGHIFI